jgi:hypothetical protein
MNQKKKTRSNANPPLPTLLSVSEKVATRRINIFPKCHLFTLFFSWLWSLLSGTHRITIAIPDATAGFFVRDARSLKPKFDR